MFKNYEIKNTKIYTEQNKKFVIKNHYTKSVSRGSKYVFELWVNGKLKGVAAFGYPTGKNSPGDLECKRFCLAPRARKNTASWFMAKCIKLIKQEGKYETLVSYADPQQGHEGTIYKASNFMEIPNSRKAQVIVWGEKQVHLRVAYQKFEGNYTKTAQAVQMALKNKEAHYKSVAPKKIFCYDLKK